MRNETEMEESDKILETFDNTFNLKRVPQMKMRFVMKFYELKLKLKLKLALRKSTWIFSKFYLSLD